jgi:hypothetical protein
MANEPSPEDVARAIINARVRQVKALEGAQTLTISPLLALLLVTVITQYLNWLDADNISKLEINEADKLEVLDDIAELQHLLERLEPMMKWIRSEVSDDTGAGRGSRDADGDPRER